MTYPFIIRLKPNTNKKSVMTSKIKFENISLMENRIVLSFKSKEEVIHFPEIEKVCIKKNKIHSIYYFLFLLLSIVIMIISLKYLPIDIILLVPILIIITGGVKLYNRENYELNICLKDGRSFKQEVPLKLKDKIIETVNIIRQKVYSNGINP
jgi:hypothetical protein